MSNETAVLDDVMEIESPQEPSLPAILSGLPEDSGHELPGWFRSRQREAWTRFTSLPNPNREDQAWRFSNVNALDLTPFVVASAPNEQEHADILDRSRFLEHVDHRVRVRP